MLVVVSVAAPQLAISYVLQADLELVVDPSKATIVAEKRRQPQRPAGSPPSSDPGTDPDVETAHERMTRAREELRQAQAVYRDAIDRARRQSDRLRSMSVGEVIDGAVEFVQKHPAMGLATAVALGFVVGRWIHRR
jgi:ElaB/YqjD/DUF883 family membrane-anchored ribosome-binding protein